ncbi:MAG: cobalamin-binding protein [Desulfobacterales bacterium]|nr:cobalamin-binding protein [Desulfobacteraceae bacterium]MDY0312615.1 cobalamin-binding protein [Desulfobacterales bacterium]
MTIRFCQKPRLAIFGFMVVLLLAGTADAGARRTVTDLAGRTLEVPVDPRRVVALAPSATEIVFAIDRQDRLVGVSRFSDTPEAARALPKVGSYVHLDLERIVALKPDLCLAIRDGNPKAVVDRLEAMGIPVYAVDPRDLASVMETVAAVGDLLNARETALRLVTDMRRRIDAVDRRVAKAAHRPRVFLQIGMTPIVSAGASTFLHELITRAGGVNAAAGATAYPRFSQEQVIALAPEVLIITSMNREGLFQQALTEWRRWPQMPAVANNRIHIVDSNCLDRPSPRLVEGLEQLARLIHPTLFEGPP